MRIRLIKTKIPLKIRLKFWIWKPACILNKSEQVINYPNFISFPRWMFLNFILSILLADVFRGTCAKKSISVGERYCGASAASNPKSGGWNQRKGNIVRWMLLRQLYRNSNSKLVSHSYQNDTALLILTGVIYLYALGISLSIYLCKREKVFFAVEEKKVW